MQKETTDFNNPVDTTKEIIQAVDSLEESNDIRDTSALLPDLWGVEEQPEEVVTDTTVTPVTVTQVPIPEEDTLTSDLPDLWGEPVSVEPPQESLRAYPLTPQQLPMSEQLEKPTLLDNLDKAKRKFSSSLGKTIGSGLKMFTDYKEAKSNEYATNLEYVPDALASSGIELKPNKDGRVLLSKDGSFVSVANVPDITNGAVSEDMVKTFLHVANKEGVDKVSDPEKRKALVTKYRGESQAEGAKSQAYEEFYKEQADIYPMDELVRDYTRAAQRMDKRAADDKNILDKSLTFIINSLDYANLSDNLEQSIGRAAGAGDYETADKLSAINQAVEEHKAKGTKDRGPLLNFARGIAEGTVGLPVYMGKRAAAGAIPFVGPLASYSMTADQGRGFVYKEARKRGASKEDAALYAGLSAPLYAVVERLQFKQLKPSAVGKKAVEGAVEETAEEAVKNTVLQKIKEGAKTVVEKTPERVKNVLKESGEEAAQDFLLEGAVQASLASSDQPVVTSDGRVVLDKDGNPVTHGTLARAIEAAKAGGESFVGSLFSFGALQTGLHLGGKIRDAATSKAQPAQTSVEEAQPTQTPEAPVADLTPTEEEALLVDLEAARQEEIAQPTTAYEETHAVQAQAAKQAAEDVAAREAETQQAVEEPVQAEVESDDSLKEASDLAKNALSIASRVQETATAVDKDNTVTDAEVVVEETAEEAANKAEAAVEDSTLKAVEDGIRETVDNKRQELDKAKEVFDSELAKGADADRGAMNEALVLINNTMSTLNSVATQLKQTIKRQHSRLKSLSKNIDETAEKLKKEDTSSSEKITLSNQLNKLTTVFEKLEPQYKDSLKAHDKVVGTMADLSWVTTDKLPTTATTKVSARIKSEPVIQLVRLRDKIRQAVKDYGQLKKEVRGKTATADTYVNMAGKLEEINALTSEYEGKVSDAKTSMTDELAVLADERAALEETIASLEGTKDTAERRQLRNAKKGLRETTLKIKPRENFLRSIGEDVPSERATQPRPTQSAVDLPSAPTASVSKELTDAISLVNSQTTTEVASDGEVKQKPLSHLETVETVVDYVDDKGISGEEKNKIYDFFDIDETDEDAYRQGVRAETYRKPGKLVEDRDLLDKVLREPISDRATFVNTLTKLKDSTKGSNTLRRVLSKAADSSSPRDVIIAYRDKLKNAEASGKIKVPQRSTEAMGERLKQRGVVQEEQVSSTSLVPDEIVKAAQVVMEEYLPNDELLVVTTADILDLGGNLTNLKKQGIGTKWTSLLSAATGAEEVLTDDSGGLHLIVVNHQGENPYLNFATNIAGLFVDNYLNDASVDVKRELLEDYKKSLKGEDSTAATDILDVQHLLSFREFIQARMRDTLLNRTERRTVLGRFFTKLYRELRRLWDKLAGILGEDVKKFNPDENMDAWLSDIFQATLDTREVRTPLIEDKTNEKLLTPSNRISIDDLKTSIGRQAFRALPREVRNSAYLSIGDLRVLRDRLLKSGDRRRRFLVDALDRFLTYKTKAGEGSADIKVGDFLKADKRLGETVASITKFFTTLPKSVSIPTVIIDTKYTDRPSGYYTSDNTIVVNNIMDIENLPKYLSSWGFYELLTPDERARFVNEAMAATHAMADQEVSNEDILTGNLPSTITDAFEEYFYTDLLSITPVLLRSTPEVRELFVYTGALEDMSKDIVERVNNSTEAKHTVADVAGKSPDMARVLTSIESSSDLNAALSSHADKTTTRKKAKEELQKAKEKYIDDNNLNTSAIQAAAELLGDKGKLLDEMAGPNTLRDKDGKPLLFWSKLQPMSILRGALTITTEPPLKTDVSEEQDRVTRALLKDKEQMKALADVFSEVLGDRKLGELTPEEQYNLVSDYVRQNIRTPLNTVSFFAVDAKNSISLVNNVIALDKEKVAKVIRRLKDITGRNNVTAYKDKLAATLLNKTTMASIVDALKKAQKELSSPATEVSAIIKEIAVAHEYDLVTDPQYNTVMVTDSKQLLSVTKPMNLSPYFNEINNFKDGYTSGWADVRYYSIENIKKFIAEETAELAGKALVTYQEAKNSMMSSDLQGLRQAYSAFTTAATSLDSHITTAVNDLYREQIQAAAEQTEDISKMFGALEGATDKGKIKDSLDFLLSVIPLSPDKYARIMNELSKASTVKDYQNAIKTARRYWAMEVETPVGAQDAAKTALYIAGRYDSLLESKHVGSLLDLLRKYSPKTSADDLRSFWQYKKAGELDAVSSLPRGVPSGYTRVNTAVNKMSQAEASTLETMAILLSDTYSVIENKISIPVTDLSYDIAIATSEIDGSIYNINNKNTSIGRLLADKYNHELSPLVESAMKLETLLYAITGLDTEQSMVGSVIYGGLDAANSELLKWQAKYTELVKESLELNSVDINRVTDIGARTTLISSVTSKFKNTPSLSLGKRKDNTGGSTEVSVTIGEAITIYNHTKNTGTAGQLTQPFIYNNDNVVKSGGMRIPSVDRHKYFEFTQEDIDKIVSWLGSYEGGKYKAFADDLYAILNTVGTMLFNKGRAEVGAGALPVENYWALRRANSTASTSADVESMQLTAEALTDPKAFLSNAALFKDLTLIPAVAKERDVNAVATIVAEDGLTSFTRSMKLSAHYGSYAGKLLAMMNMLKELTPKLRESGMDAQLATLLKHIDAETNIVYARETGVADKVLSKVRRNIYKKQLGSNPFVILKQPASLLGAGYYIPISDLMRSFKDVALNPKSYTEEGRRTLRQLAKVNAAVQSLKPDDTSKKANALREKAMKLSAKLNTQMTSSNEFVVAIEQMKAISAQLYNRVKLGIVDTEVGSDVMANEIQHMFDIKVDDPLYNLGEVFMSGIKAADARTIASIWVASRTSIKSSTPGISEQDLLEQTAKLAELAVRRTQPMYGSKDRPLAHKLVGRHGISRDVLSSLMAYTSVAASQNQENYRSFIELIYSLTRDSNNHLDKKQAATKVVASVTKFVGKAAFGILVFTLLPTVLDLIRDLLAGKSVTPKKAKEYLATYVASSVYSLGGKIASSAFYSRIPDKDDPENIQFDYVRFLSSLLSSFTIRPIIDMGNALSKLYRRAGKAAGGDYGSPATRADEVSKEVDNLISPVIGIPLRNIYRSLEYLDVITPGKVDPFGYRNKLEERINNPYATYSMMYNYNYDRAIPYRLKYTPEVLTQFIKSSGRQIPKNVRGIEVQMPTEAFIEYRTAVLDAAREVMQTPARVTPIIQDALALNETAFKDITADIPKDQVFNYFIESDEYAADQKRKILGGIIKEAREDPDVQDVAEQLRVTLYDRGVIDRQLDRMGAKME